MPQYQKGRLPAERISAVSARRCSSASSTAGNGAGVGQKLTWTPRDLQHAVGVARELHAHKARIVNHQAVPLVRNQHLGQPQTARMHAVECKVGSVDAKPMMLLYARSLTHDDFGF